MLRKAGILFAFVIGTVVAKEQWVNPQLQPLLPERHCNDGSCSIDIENVTLWRDKERLTKRGADKKAISLIQPQGKQDFPKVDWEPLSAYAILMGEKYWGKCFAMSHQGWKNGGRQLWASLILVPTDQHHAYRLFGYDLMCEHLQINQESDKIMISVREEDVEEHIDKKWICSAVRCQQYKQ